MPPNLAKVTEDTIRGSFFLVTGNILWIAVSAVTVFIVARLLGPELYGVYTVSLVLPTLSLLLGDLGINQGLIRFSASLRTRGADESLKIMLRYAFIFKLLIGIVVFSICFLFSDYLATYVIARPDYAFYARLAATSIIFQVMFNTASFAFIGLDRMEYNALVKNIQALVSALFSPLLVFLGFSLVGAITGFIIGYIVAGLFAVSLFFFKLYKPLNLNNYEQTHSHGGNIFKTFLSYGFPLYVSTLLLSFSTQFQTIILAFFTSDAEIGNFKASLNFIVLLSVLTLPIANSFFQAFSKFERNGDPAKRFFTITTKYMSIVVVPVTMLMIIFSKEVIQIVYGTSYLLAPFFLSIYALDHFLVGLGRHVQRGFFNGLGQTKITFIKALASFAVFISLAPLLTLTYGALGLVVAFLLSSLTSTVTGAYIAKSRFDAHINYGIMVRIYSVALVSSIPTFLATTSLHLPTLLTLILGVLVYLFTYVTLVPITGIITKAELDELQRATEKIKLLKPMSRTILMYERRLLDLLKHMNKTRPGWFSLKVSK